MLDTDVRTEPQVDEDDERNRFFNRRRVVRVVAILTIGILAVLAIWQDPLYAGRF
ncbi:hypothetical protein [Actinoplanes sp. NPDC049316]|uniref:hypothetical protein n=1 Tax=Actinoplanes sp. NPDC049316 TaxID=3154727 RepID=UPI00341E0AC9